MVAGDVFEAENIRDRVREEVAAKLYGFDRQRIPNRPYSELTRNSKDVYRWQADQILSVEGLVVLDESQSLPEIIPFTRNELTAYNTQDECYQNGQAYMVMKFREANFRRVKGVLSEG